MGFSDSIAASYGDPVKYAVCTSMIMRKERSIARLF